jgi:hypothetical protein
MTKTAHTPGPWKAWQPRGDESVPVRTDGLGITIAYVHQGAVTDAQANARLIAAAPDLLIAVQRCLNFIEGTEAEFGEEFECGNIARAAIAKAEGQP